MSDRNQKILEVFREIDKDNNGVLSHQEIIDAINTLELGQELSELIKYVRHDNDGKVDIEEFLRVVTLEETGSQVFEKIDRDRSGTLTMKEVVDATKDLELDTKKLFSLMNLIRKDNDGAINKAEFMGVWLSADLLNEFKLLKTFQSIDKDGNGFLSEDEIKEATKSADVAKVVNVENLLQYAKHDADGKVSCIEFMQVLKFSKIWDNIDRDKNGKMTKSEIRFYGFLEIERKKFYELLNDVKDDDKLDFNEFMELMRK